ncbi:MAG: hypothetical protein ACJAS4_002680 [Bacteriovoracaceae bacterium]|jgi:hypothetical protein
MIFKNGLSTYPYIANAGFGVKFKAKSVLIKTGEDIIIISPANFENNVIEELKKDTLNKVFIAPNNFHNLNISKMKAVFPEAKFYGPKRSEQQSGVSLIRSRELNLGDDIIAIPIEGNFKLSETCFYHVPSETLIITDILFNMHHEMNYSTRIALTLAGAYHKLGMSRFLRLMINDKVKFKNSLERLLDHPFKNIILNHGDSIGREEFIRFLKKF